MKQLLGVCSSGRAPHPVEFSKGRFSAGRCCCPARCVTALWDAFLHES